VAHGEVCDTGATRATCDSDCTAVQCGDGVLNAPAGEQCDRGEPSALCDGDCTTAYCGDGTVNELRGEECDDGNDEDGDGCSAVCMIEP
jgi:cysteine-rich repeat protein